MPITTHTGKTITCDLAVESPSTERLYLNCVGMTPVEAAGIFLNPAELPLEGYAAYTVFESMNVSPNGTAITLRKGGR